MGEDFGGEVFGADLFFVEGFLEPRCKAEFSLVALTDRNFAPESFVWSG
jgi:hypothetical protein